MSYVQSIGMYQTSHFIDTYMLNAIELVYLIQRPLRLDLDPTE